MTSPCWRFTECPRPARNEAGIILRCQLGYIRFADGQTPSRANHSKLEESSMKKLMNLFVAFSVLAGSLLQAATLTINNPATGTGPTWDCKLVDGTTTGCPPATPIRGLLYKLGGNGMWSPIPPNGSLFPTATTGTILAGKWTTKPDWTLGTQNTFTAPGNYKVQVTATLTNGVTNPVGQNFWVIP